MPEPDQDQSQPLELVIDALKNDQRLRQEFVRQKGRIEYEPCTEPAVAELIEGFGVDFLLDTLALPNEVFVDLVGSAGFGVDNKSEVRSLIQNHFEQCHHCQLVDEQNQLMVRRVEAALDQQLIDQNEEERLGGRPRPRPAHHRAAHA